MAPIHQLPVELLDRIAELSCPKESTALTLVCRAFNAVATRYAYRLVLLQRHHEKPHGIRLFLRTLLDKPNVGAYVRHLVVHVTDSLYQSRLNDPEPSDTPADLRRFAGDATSRRISEVSNAILHGSIGAMLLLLLCHLPALQFLGMNPLISFNHLLFRPIQDDPTVFPALQSLRSLNISHWKTASFHLLAPFLRLPQISSIYCFNTVMEDDDLDDSDDNDVSDNDSNNDSNNEDTDDSDEDDSDNDNDNDCDNNGDSDNNGGDNHNSDNTSHGGVIIILLTHCIVNADVLAAFVKSTQRLKFLIYRHDETHGSAVFSGESLGRALRTHAKNTLEYLELDFKCGRAGFFQPLDALGSLRDFTHLWHIAVPISLLLDEPSPGLALDLGVILPRSLTSLSLRIDGDWEEAGWELIVLQLLQNKQETVPLLERLHVVGYIDDDVEEAIQGACDAAQVDVTFR